MSALVAGYLLDLVLIVFGLLAAGFGIGWLACELLRR